jgi:hypothetical protein
MGGPSPFRPSTQLTPPDGGAGATGLSVLGFTGEAGVGYYGAGQIPVAELARGSAAGQILVSGAATSYTPAYQTVTGDCVMAASGACSVVSASGSSATFPVTAPYVQNVTSPGNGAYTWELPPAGPLTGASGTITFAIPVNTSGTLSAIVSARTGTDGGASGGTATWTCGVINHGGACGITSACTASQAWAATDAAASWSASLAVSGCTGTITVSGGASSTHWGATVQYASVS